MFSLLVNYSRRNCERNIVLKNMFLKTFLSAFADNFMHFQPVSFMFTYALYLMEGVDKSLQGCAFTCFACTYVNILNVRELLFKDGV